MDVLKYVWCRDCRKARHCYIAKELLAFSSSAVLGKSEIMDSIHEAGIEAFGPALSCAAALGVLMHLIMRIF